MAPLPKRKLSKARQGEKSSHRAISLPAISTCPQCRSPKLAHRACPSCGSYGGRVVIPQKEASSQG